nr:MAG TPA: hypothetical protein [Caudoviricetes sp.]
MTTAKAVDPVRAVIGIAAGWTHLKMSGARDGNKVCSCQTLTILLFLSSDFFAVVTATLVRVCDK